MYLSPRNNEKGGDDAGGRLLASFFTVYTRSRLPQTVAKAEIELEASTSLADQKRLLAGETSREEDRARRQLEIMEVRVLHDADVRTYRYCSGVPGAWQQAACLFDAEDTAAAPMPKILHEEKYMDGAQVYIQHGIFYIPLALESIVRVYSEYLRSGAVHCLVIVRSWLRSWIGYILFYSEEVYSGEKHERACEGSYI